MFCSFLKSCIPQSFRSYDYLSPVGKTIKFLLYNVDSSYVHEIIIVLSVIVIGYDKTRN